jgi:hypothetical protein
MDTKIIVAGFVIGGSGVINAIINNKPLTPILIGSYVLVLVLAITQSFGGPIATLSDALAMLAMLYVLLVEFPWKQLLSFVQGGKI